MPFNVCFVPNADIIMYQSTRRQPVSQLVGDGSELSKVVAPYQRHRGFLSVPTLSYSCFKQLSLLKLEQDWLFYY